MNAGGDDQQKIVRDTSVFFSYSRKDQTQALPLIKAIEAMGYSVWWDGMLEGGSTFLETTEDALESAKAVIVLWSENSISSHWVRDEATSGRDRDRIIPLTLDGTMPPLGFRQVQLIDVQDWQRSPNALTDLGRSLAKLHDREYKPLDRRTLAAIAPQSTDFTLSRRHAVFAGLGLGALGALGVGGVYVLRSTQSGTTGASLAIMPFENRLGDPDFDYVAQGLSSAVRDQLSKNKFLRVIARSSSIAAAAENTDVQAIGEQLGIAHILEGRLERGPDGIELICSLVEAQSAIQRWTRSYTNIPDAITSVRDKLVDATFTTLARDLTDPFAATQGKTENPQAFLEYMRGDKKLSEASTLDDIGEARQHFERAVVLDPTFSRAHADLAEVYLVLGAYSSEKDLALGLLDQAEQSARTAATLAPDDSLIQTILGTILQSGRINVEAASVPFERAKEIGLSDASAYSRYAVFLMSSGRTAEAVEQAIKARGLDPLNPARSETLGLGYFADRQYSQAATAYEMALYFQPNRYTTRARLANALILDGQIDKGLSQCAQERATMERYPCEAFAATRQNAPERAQAALDQLIAEHGDAAAYQQAQIEADMGQLDLAMETLLKAERLRDTGLTLIAFDPALDALRDREDFKALLVRLGLKA